MTTTPLPDPNPARLGNVLDRISNLLTASMVDDTTTQGKDFNALLDELQLRIEDWAGVQEVEFSQDRQPLTTTGYQVPVEMTVEVDGPDLDAWMANPVGDDPREVARQQVQDMVETMIPWGFWVDHVDTEGEVAYVDAEGTVNL